ncbi:SRPBCC domain-containing protein [Sediminibacterium roseum]|uniref:SRPBCC domain-containing protein n=1 Tax=Sediminibacterium roseum TaxID=1978412 RepID=A0ABW9ZPJ8_9BACT|nr:SRPBCC domain-containing protein [Sediminibacterium roseum]NCI49008.1 SRPBCC domain-containing protein [Sediminibacterium roseum]
MENLNFKITINATKEKVWDALFSDASYREWTAAFAEGSRAETDWKQGSKAYFTDGNNSGMVSEIEVSRPYEFLSIKHLGILKDGVEDLTSEETLQWAGAHENYTLRDAGGKTELLIDLESKGMKQEFIDYFNGTWPVALEKLKAIAER